MLLLDLTESKAGDSWAAVQQQHFHCINIVANL